jgi:prepilin-type N-terminal cleavage/methylation domain-containing protein
LLHDSHSRPTDSPSPRDRSGEAGYSLIELLAVISVLVVLLGAVLALGETTNRIAPRDTDRAHAIRDAQVGLHGMTRQLRQAYQLHAATAYTMDVSVVVGGVARRFSYECDEPHPTKPTYNRCYRYEVVGGSKGDGKLVIDRVLNGPNGTGGTNPIFTFETNASGNVTYATAAVDVPAKGDRQVGHRHKIPLYDGFYMRNLDV